MSTAEHNHRIDYIELMAADLVAAKAFYQTVFGWTFKDYGDEYTSFKDGRLAGGLRKEAHVVSGGPLVVLYGADLEDLQARVEAAGGKIVKPVFEFPGGRRFHFTDPDGYELAVWTEA